MDIRHLNFIATAAILLTITIAVRAGDPESVTLSPAIKDALTQLNADDFNDRKKAVAQLQEAIGQQLATLIDLDDGDTAIQMHSILNSSLAMTRWAIHVLDLSAEGRKAQLALAQKPKFFPLLGGIYGDDTIARLDAIKELGVFSDVAVDDILADVIRSDDKVAAVAAMDAAYSRPLNENLVNALFYRAVEVGFIIQDFNFQKTLVTFQGKNQEVLQTPRYVARWSTDAFDAHRVLSHAKSPHLIPLLDSFFNKVFADLSAIPKKMGGTWHLTNGYQPTEIAYELAGESGDLRLLPILQKIAASPNLVALAGARYPYSARTPAVVAALQIEGKDPMNAGFVYMDPGRSAASPNLEWSEAFWVPRTTSDVTTTTQAAAK